MMIGSGCGVYHMGSAMADGDGRGWRVEFLFLVRVVKDSDDVLYDINDYTFKI